MCVVVVDTSTLVTHVRTDPKTAMDPAPQAGTRCILTATTNIRAQVAPKFKGKPTASCQHNFLAHLCAEHESIADVQRVVRDLADRSLSGRDYREPVRAAPAEQDDAPSDSKTVTGSSFIHQQVCCVAHAAVIGSTRAGHTGQLGNVVQRRRSSAPGGGRPTRHRGGERLPGCQRQCTLRGRQQRGQQRRGGQRRRQPRAGGWARS